jgi:hypothetical protein
MVSLISATGNSHRHKAEALLESEEALRKVLRKSEQQLLQRIQSALDKQVPLLPLQLQGRSSASLWEEGLITTVSYGNRV